MYVLLRLPRAFVSVVVFHAWRNRKSVTAAVVILVVDVDVVVVVWTVTVASSTARQSNRFLKIHNRRTNEAFGRTDCSSSSSRRVSCFCLAVNSNWIRATERLRCHMRKTHSRCHRQARKGSEAQPERMLNIGRAVDNISFLRENVVDWSGECVAVVVLFSPIECRADVASLELGLVLRDMHVMQ